MPTIAKPTKREVVKFALIGSALVGSLVAGRWLGARKTSGAERLAEALLDTERLRDAGHKLPESTEAVLAACAAYAIGVSYRAAEGVGTARAAADPPGYSRTHTHPYTHASATVLTETPPAARSHGDEETASSILDQVLTYAVTIPETGEVRGTRRVGPLHMAELSLARPAPDIVQITLKDGYTAQMESQYEVGEFLMTGKTRLFGSATLRDNRGNAGRLTIGYDGRVSGTITCGGRVVGRFEGHIPNAVTFKQYQIEPGAGDKA